MMEGKKGHSLSRPDDERGRGSERLISVRAREIQSRGTEGGKSKEARKNIGRKNSGQNRQSIYPKDKLTEQYRSL